MNAIIKGKLNQEATESTALDESKSKTDWDRIRNMSLGDIEKAIMDDPDSAPLETDETLKAYKLAAPRIKKDARQ